MRFRKVCKIFQIKCSDWREASLASFDNVSQTWFANFRLLLRQPGKVGADMVSESEFYLGKRESYVRSRELGRMIEFLNAPELSPAREYRPNE